MEAHAPLWRKRDPERTGSDRRFSSPQGSEAVALEMPAHSVAAFVFQSRDRRATVFRAANPDFASRLIYAGATLAVEFDNLVITGV